MSEVKFREFYIDSEGESNLTMNVQRGVMSYNFKNAIHVIEYAALAAKDTEIERLNAKLTATNENYRWLIYHSFDCAAISKAKASELLGISLIDFDHYYKEMKASRE